MKGTLTDTKIKACKPKNNPYRVFDGGGLYIEIHPNGSKYWRLKYRISDKEKLLAPGKYPSASLKKVCKERDKARELSGGATRWTPHRKAAKW